MNYFEKRLWHELHTLRVKELRAKQFIDYMFANRAVLTEEDIQLLDSWYNHSNKNPVEIMSENA